MNAQSGMKRLEQVYAMVDQMRLAERRAAAAELDDAVCAATIAEVARETQRSEGRVALGEGDRAGWTIAETTREVMDLRIVRLRAVRARREAALEAATILHRESRLRLEQIKVLVERAAESQVMEEGRREQAAVDDRFGSRLAWRRGRERE